MSSKTIQNVFRQRGKFAPAHLIVHGRLRINEPGRVQRFQIEQCYYYVFNEIDSSVQQYFQQFVSARVRMLNISGNKGIQIITPSLFIATLFISLIILALGNIRSKKMFDANEQNFI